MKKRLSFILIYLCLLSLLTLGAGELLLVDKAARPSETENRMLQGFPEFSRASVSSGAFMDGVEGFLSDGFFFRKEAAEAYDRVMGLFSRPADGPETGVVAEEQLWEGNTAEALPDDPGGEEGTVLPYEAPVSAPEGAELTDAQLWLVDVNGEREVLFTYPASALASFAEILNRCRALLPEDGHVFFANPQVAAVANNVIRDPHYTGWGSDLEEVLQPLTDDGVVIVDCTDVLTPHMEDMRLYPAEDYHWHSAAASLVVDEMIRAQGVAPAQFDQYRYYLSNKHNGVAYSVQALAGMRYGRDTIEIMAPISPAKSFLLTHLTQREKAVFTYFEGGYVGFLGGHKGPWRLFEGGFHTGRSALVIGDCFTPPMIPYMVPYYDVIISTDVRDNFYSAEEAGASIAQYIETYGVDDIYVVYSTNSRFTGEALQSRLLGYLFDEP